jgi:hypothetical protein
MVPFPRRDSGSCKSLFRLALISLVAFLAGQGPSAAGVAAPAAEPFGRNGHQRIGSDLIDATGPSRSR